MRLPKVGIYCRLSIEDKDKADSNDSRSIQNQREMLCDYCMERGWEIFDIYVDDGYSGIDRSRPDFNRLLSDCENGDIDIVLCKDQSRFSRDTIIIEQYINDKFLEWGVRFIGVADNSDTESESYSTMRLFASAYNEMYVKDISAKIRRTLEFKRQQGQFVGSFAPYGYSISQEDKHRLVIDEKTAPVVRRIFDMYVSGEGYRRIVQYLNSEGIVSPTEYKRRNGSKYVNCNADSRGLWTQSTVARILANEVYTGTLVQGKSHHISYKNKKRRKVDKKDWVRIPDAHEAIIDAETWAKTQERISSRTRVGNCSYELSPLAGKVRCAVCGRPMKRNVYYNKARTIRYYGLQCASYKSGAMDCPNTRSISGVQLEQKILDELNRIIDEYCQVEDVHIDDIRSDQIVRLEKKQSALSESITSVKEHIMKMYMDKLDGVISSEDYFIFRQQLGKEEASISAQLSDIENRLDKLLDQRSEEPDINDFLHFDKLDRITADEFIDFIEIGMADENGERDVVVHWNV